MGIRKTGYASWEGKLSKTDFTWIPIFLKGIKEVTQKRGAKIIFFLSSLPFFVFAVAIYISSKPELDFLADLVEILKDDASIFYTYYTNGFLVFWLIILCILSGSNLISDDIKYKSLTLYFSRPLSVFDYIFGKLSIILFYLLMFSLVPGLSLIILKMLFSGEINFNLINFLSSILLPLIISVYLGLITLLLSSISDNNRFVKIAIFMAYFFSDIAYSISREIINNDIFALMSIKENIKILGIFLFRIENTYSFSPWIVLITIGLTIIISFYFINLRVKNLEKI